jgi:hypothetical protein
MNFAPLSASSTVAQGAPLAFRGDKEICRHLPLPSWSPSLESRTRNDERRTRVACGDSETTHGIPALAMLSAGLRGGPDKRTIQHILQQIAASPSTGNGGERSFGAAS